MNASPHLARNAFIDRTDPRGRKPQGLLHERVTV